MPLYKSTTQISDDDGDVLEIDAAGALAVSLAEGAIIVDNHPASNLATDDLSKIVNGFCENGGSEDLTVDGSVTPVEFTFSPPTNETVALYHLVVRFVSNDWKVAIDKFGDQAALTNGLKFEIQAQGFTSELVNVKHNLDWHLAFTFDIDRSGDDMIVMRAGFGGVLQLDETQGDFVKVTVRDDLTPSQHILLDCFVQSIQVT